MSPPVITVGRFSPRVSNLLATLRVQNEEPLREVPLELNVRGTVDALQLPVCFSHSVIELMTGSIRLDNSMHNFQQ